MSSHKPQQQQQKDDAGENGAYVTQSGREVRKSGKRNISGGLAQLRAAREGGDKRTDQYQVSTRLVCTQTCHIG